MGDKKLTNVLLTKEEEEHQQNKVYKQRKNHLNDFSLEEEEMNIELYEFCKKHLK